MYKRKTILIGLAIFLVFFTMTTMSAYANFETKTSIINKYKALCTSYPTLATWVSIGKSVQNRDIPMFRIGNKSVTGIILWDAQMHGSEDAGSETGYLFARWLLTSGDTRARYMLAHNYFLFIPVVNIDTTARTNMHHVNLNRNFPVGWGRSGSSSPSSTEYRGPSAGSEPETKALINVFKTYKIRFYINTHSGGGPIIYKQSSVPSSTITTLRSRIVQYKAIYGGSPDTANRWHSLSGAGLAVGTSASYGIQSFLWEITPSGGAIPYSDITGKYYKDTRVFLIAIASMCG